MGFEERPSTSGTSHVKWVGYFRNEKRVVTVDKHVEPFSKDLIKSIANQAGMSMREFHAVCKSKEHLKQLAKDNLELNSD